MFCTYRVLCFNFSEQKRRAKAEKKAAEKAEKAEKAAEEVAQRPTKDKDTGKLLKDEDPIDANVSFY